jgi:lysophospholipase L1-like esterase
MKVFVIVISLAAVAWSATPVWGAPPKRKPRVAAPAISAKTRAAALEEIKAKVIAVKPGFENAAALKNFFEAAKPNQPIHVVQFGDSHTASDDWVNSMRVPAQARYGDGGPGFIQAGHPYRGYRRFDASGANSAGWKTQGTMAIRSDANQGLSGISLSTALADQTITLKASGSQMDLFYLQQPGGGQIQISVDDQISDTIWTDGGLGPGHYAATLSPGQHQLTLRTLNAAPVRVYGWAMDNPQGITFETLGINGALAHVILNGNEQIWAGELAQRNPALVIVAYGTNEANSHSWTAEQYRSELKAVLDRIHHAAANASILLIGPPDCGRLRPLLHLTEVIDIQREVALANNAAFWDWRAHMGGPGIVKRWVTAGLSQADYIHLTGAGYRMIGEMIFNQLEASSPDSHE